MEERRRMRGGHEGQGERRGGIGEKMKWEGERKSEREERITSRSERRRRGERIGRGGS